MSSSAQYAQTSNAATWFVGSSFGGTDRGPDLTALAAYGARLAVAPEMADAHCSSALIYEKLGNAQRALRHISAYRRLQC